MVLHVARTHGLRYVVTYLFLWCLGLSISQTFMLAHCCQPMSCLGRGTSGVLGRCSCARLAEDHLSPVTHCIPILSSSSLMRSGYSSGSFNQPNLAYKCTGTYHTSQPMTRTARCHLDGTLQRIKELLPGTHPVCPKIIETFAGKAWIPRKPARLAVHTTSQ